MKITSCSNPDFDHILDHLNEYWEIKDSERFIRIRILHSPILIYELGNTTYIVKDGDNIAAYLFGFFSQTEPVGYVQFIATHRNYKRQRLASRLYDHFADVAKGRGCTAIKAITSPGNTASINFHRSIGMELLGQPNEQGVPVVTDYAGPGEPRVVFFKRI